jgi:gamma-glutamyltranspeptidase
MNNGIMWFDPDAGRPNSLAPGKRCLTNYCPIIAEQADRRFALGATLSSTRTTEETGAVKIDRKKGVRRLSLTCVPFL